MYHTRLSVSCHPEFSEILIAELSEAGFETFLENEKGFEAYVEGEAFNPSMVEEIRKKYGKSTPLEFVFSHIPKKNWNEEWEKSYQPIVVNDRCLIRAGFHVPEKQYAYEVIITPKMSFGTGHHQTTYLMVKNMLDVDHTNKRVMDAGCGTAILSILASKLGAREVESFDIDEWSVENGNENTLVNGCTNIHIQQGTIREAALQGKFDIILANINKNVLLEEMNIYSSFLNAGGYLLLSGFFTLDIPDLLREAARHHLREIRRDDRDTWAALLLNRTAT
jgi:ribosomal protein L11 methyltransferase